MRVSVDGVELEVAAGASVLEAVEQAGGRLPTLCYDDRLAPFGACRTCLVGLEGAPAPVPACTTHCREGMRIDTATRRPPGSCGRSSSWCSPSSTGRRRRAPSWPGWPPRSDSTAGRGGRFEGATHEVALDERHPYLAFQHELCISCGRCVRACDEVQGAFALTVTGRGFHSNVTAGLDSGFQDSSCVSCGACADTCPTGRSSSGGFLHLSGSEKMGQRPESPVATTCGYCGVGCRLEAHVADGELLSITPSREGPANRGHACLKGRFAHRFVSSPDRLTKPLIRSGSGMREASWEEAIETIATRLQAIRDEHGPDAIAGLASSRATNEDCFAMARLMRAAIGTNNIDNCSRVCHSPTSFALRRSFGLSGATGSFSDIDAADAAIIIGANPTQAHPVVGARIKQAALRGLKLVTIDPRRIELADYGELHLAPRPGTNAAVLLGLAHVLVADGLLDERFIEERTEGSEATLELLEQYTPRAVQEISGIPAADIEHAAHIYGEAAEASIIWGLGVTEHKYGSEVVQLICNLAMLTGKVGRRGSALLPLRGQNNVQGSSDMGALPDTHSGYRPVGDEQVARSFEAAWGVQLPRRPGYKVPEMFDAAVAGELKAMYIFGEDVAQTDPDSAHVANALQALDFLVCQDIFPNETTAYADVILPASAFLEKEGTFTNAERRIQLV